MKLVIAEKPSVARSLARVIGADKRCDGYLEGGGYLVSWCVGHLVELSAPEPFWIVQLKAGDLTVSSRRFSTKNDAEAVLQDSQAGQFL